MTGIVVELQQDALNKQIQLADLLRKALVVAHKLKLLDFETWIQSELDGYQDGMALPDYRFIRGSVKIANPLMGLQPVIFGDSKYADRFSKRSLAMSVAAMEDALIKRQSGDYFTMQYPADVEKDLMKATHCDMQPLLVFDPAQVVSVLDSIRTMILNWALKLEDEGIHGDGLSFTKEEKEAALKPAFTINNFFGSITQSQIQQNTVDSTQEYELKGFDAEEVKTLLRTLEELLPQASLKPDKQKELRAEITTIKDQLESPKPKEGIIRQSITVMIRILENATGSAAGQVLIELGKLLT